MNNEREIILRKSSILKDVTPEEYEQFFRTKDIYVSAFLTARGCEIYAIEEVKIDKPVKKNIFIFFLFKEKSKLEHLALNYHNQNRASLNVNANAFVQSILSIRSIVTNPPF